MWEYEDLERCNTVTCPLNDMAEDSSPTMIRYTRENCFCQDDEYIWMHERSPLFVYAWQLLQEMNTGFPPPSGTPIALRWAVTKLKTELDTAQNEYREAHKDDNKNSSEDEGNGSYN